MKTTNGLQTGYVRRYLLAVVGAMVLALAVAMPVFAQEDTTGEDGGTVQPQIVGGDPVANGKFPFVAALLDITRGDTGREQQFCGGTLLDEDSVLTAAHCLEGATPVPLRVAVGRTELNSDQGQTRRVTAIFRHPRYSSSAVSFRYDAAVLTLDNPVRGIEPVRIPQPNQNEAEQPGRNATIAGWGNTEKQGTDFNQPDSFPNRMQEAQVPLVSDDRAKKVYDSGYAKALMVAAGKEGKDTCQGDSGGPMFKSVNGSARQIGITSFGNGCGARGFPGVYAETNSPEIRSFIINSAGL